MNSFFFFFGWNQTFQSFVWRNALDLLVQLPRCSIFQAFGNKSNPMTRTDLSINKFWIITIRTVNKRKRFDKFSVYPAWVYKYRTHRRTNGIWSRSIHQSVGALRVIRSIIFKTCYEVLANLCLRGIITESKFRLWLHPAAIIPLLYLTLKRVDMKFIAPSSWIWIYFSPIFLNKLGKKWKTKKLKFHSATNDIFDTPIKTTRRICSFRGSIPHEISLANHG